MIRAQGALAWEMQGSGCKCDGLQDAQAKGHFLLLASYCPCQPGCKVRAKNRRGRNEIERSGVIGAGLTKENEC